jgi:hypothetical protein
MEWKKCIIRVMKHLCREGRFSVERMEFYRLILKEWRNRKVFPVSIIEVQEFLDKNKDLLTQFNIEIIEFDQIGLQMREIHA